MADGELSFSIRPTGRLNAFRLIAGAVGVAFSAFAIGNVVTQTGAARAAYIAFAVVALVFGLTILWQGVGSYRHPPGVHLANDVLSSSDFFGRAHRASVDEIERIEYRSRTYGRSIMPNRVPYVRLRDGSGFWLDGLAAPEKSSDDLARQDQMLTDIKATLGIS